MILITSKLFRFGKPIQYFIDFDFIEFNVKLLVVFFEDVPKVSWEKSTDEENADTVDLIKANATGLFVACLTYVTWHHNPVHKVPNVSASVNQEHKTEKVSAIAFAIGHLSSLQFVS